MTEIDLPACDFVLDGVKDGCYYDYTVRRLIAEAVTAEREACIAAVLDEKVDAEATQAVEDATYNSALVHAVAAIQSRSAGKQTGSEP